VSRLHCCAVLPGGGSTASNELQQAACAMHVSGVRVFYACPLVWMSEKLNDEDPVELICVVCGWRLCDFGLSG
jgi:hypothetical protein